MLHGKKTRWEKGSESFNWFDKKHLEEVEKDDSGGEDICFCLMWFLTLPLRDGQLKRGSSLPFTPFFGSRNISSCPVSCFWENAGFQLVSGVYLCWFLGKTNVGGKRCLGRLQKEGDTRVRFSGAHGSVGTSADPTLASPTHWSSLGAVESRVDDPRQWTEFCSVDRPPSLGSPSCWNSGS